MSDARSAQGVVAGQLIATGRDIFPFLSLPAELRENVYCCLLEEDKPISIDYRKRNGSWRTGVSWNRSYGHETPHHNAVALLRVSRCVYMEAAPVLYSKNTFTFDRAKDMKAWLETINKSEDTCDISSLSTTAVQPRYARHFTSLRKRPLYANLS